MSNPALRDTRGKRCAHRHDRIAPLIDPRLGRRGRTMPPARSGARCCRCSAACCRGSLPKLVLAWSMLIVLPGVLLGLTPLVVTAWLATLSGKIADPLNGLWPFLPVRIDARDRMAWRAPVVSHCRAGVLGRSTGVAVQPALRSVPSRCAPRWSVCCRGTRASAGAHTCTARRQPASFCVRLAWPSPCLVWPTSRWIEAGHRTVVSPHLIVQAPANACGS